MTTLNLDYYRNLGICFSERDGKLSIDAAPGVLTEKTLEEIKRNKKTILLSLSLSLSNREEEGEPTPVPVCSSSDAADEHRRTDELETSLNGVVNVYWEKYESCCDLPSDELTWIIDSVVIAPPEDQKRWWHLVHLWTEEAGGDTAWRRNVVTELRAEQQRRAQRQDFRIAQTMFAGIGMRVLGAA